MDEASKTPRGRRPTIADVARLSGVAPVTVSRALNLPDLVNGETRQRVFDAVSQLGYQANTAARVLAGSRWGTVGVQVPSLDHIMLRHQLQTFEAELRARNISLLISASNYDAVAEKEVIEAFLARGVDAILLTHLEEPDQIYDLMEARGVPTVMMASPGTPRAIRKIGYDDAAAMGEVADHLVGLGHRRISMLGDSRAQLNGAARVNGLAARLRHHGLDLPDHRVIRCGHEEAEAKAGFDGLMDVPVPPTAMVCGNDALALSALARAQERGIAVPRQLSVTGFDGIEVTGHPLISLSTIRAPWRRLGSGAAVMLLDAIEDNTPQNVTLPVEFIARGSTAPPPAE
ncbi:MAG: LacI family DNA-binding transcriptional regulator [Pseudomonadota bacterium]